MSRKTPPGKKVKVKPLHLSKRDMQLIAAACSLCLQMNDEYAESPELLSLAEALASGAPLTSEDMAELVIVLSMWYGHLRVGGSRATNTDTGADMSESFAQEVAALHNRIARSLNPTLTDEWCNARLEKSVRNFEGLGIDRERVDEEVGDALEALRQHQRPVQLTAADLRVLAACAGMVQAIALAADEQGFAGHQSEQQELEHGVSTVLALCDSAGADGVTRPAGELIEARCILSAVKSTLEQKHLMARVPGGLDGFCQIFGVWPVQVDALLAKIKDGPKGVAA